MKFFQRISKNSSLLNPTEKEIINYILKNKKIIKNKKIRELASELFVSPNTIMRMCKKLGYSGYSELKYEILEEKKETLKKMTPTENNNLIERLQKTISLNSFSRISEVVDSIFEKRIIYFYGLGLSRYSILSFSKKLHYLGKVCIVPDDRDSARIIFQGMTSDDLLFLVSCSGEHSDLKEFGYVAKSNGSKLITLTGLSQNPLIEISDYPLFAYIDSRNINGGDCSSRIGFDFIFDILFEEILRK